MSTRNVVSQWFQVLIALCHHGLGVVEKGSSDFLEEKTFVQVSGVVRGLSLSHIVTWLRMLA